VYYFKWIYTVYFLLFIHTRIPWNLLKMIFIFYTPHFRDALTGEYPFGFFLLCLVLSSVGSLLYTTMAISEMSFNARIVDELIGGTYMTFLSTISNISFINSSTVSLYLLDLFSTKRCSPTSSWKEIGLNGTNLLNKVFSYNKTIIQEIQANTCSSNELSKVY
jgi:hypothetical protein